MTEPFLGEIRIYSFDYAPKGWASCNGQAIQVSQNAALFALLGANYGGDRKTYFNVPDLRGRTPVGYYTNPATIGAFSRYNLGTSGGTETVTLTTTQIPAHTHSWQAVNTAATTMTPKDNVYATGPGVIFSDITTSSNPGLVALNPKIMADTGGGQPHENMQPFLVMNFCIALQGIFPSRPW